VSFDLLDALQLDEVGFRDAGDLVGVGLGDLAEGGMGLCEGGFYTHLVSDAAGFSKDRLHFLATVAVLEGTHVFAHVNLSRASINLYLRF